MFATGKFKPLLLMTSSLCIIGLGVVLVQGPSHKSASRRGAPEIALSDVEEEAASAGSFQAPAELLSRTAPVATSGAKRKPGYGLAQVSSQPSGDVQRNMPMPQLRHDDPALRQHALVLPGNGIPEPVQPKQASRERFANAEENSVNVTEKTPVSTFSVDVDTASYAWVRRALKGGQMPQADAVRAEEMINYFPYDYPAPAGAGEGAPFETTVSVRPTPWNPDTQLMHVAIQGELPEVEVRPPLNLVFLIDTSGSMDAPDKLPLLRQSFNLMLSKLRPEDEVAIVTYAGSAGIALEPTSAGNAADIRMALERLDAGGSTAGGAGLKQAYALAAKMQKEGEISRILLATDGDFNVGLQSDAALKTFVEQKRKSGTYLSVLGFGRGNLNDALMQTLAQNGNGQAAYIDTLNEAQKVLVDQLSGALYPIASDVKIQVEFNPGKIAEYRLIGYETRVLRREDFNNDRVDAGEIGAGHQVSALYEITLVGSPAIRNDPLKFRTTAREANPVSDDLAFVRLRYKRPGETKSRLIETFVADEVTAPSQDTNFAAAIAGFAQLLRNSSYLGDWGYQDAIDLANSSKGSDAYGYRAEAVQLMRLAESLSAN